MFATVHTTPHTADAVRAVLPGDAEPAGVLVVELPGDTAVVALWPDGAAAPAGARTYRVIDRIDGPAAGRTPLFAEVTWLDVRGDPAVARAAERGGRERIGPAIRDVDGLVGVLVLRSDDDRIVVVGTATGRETHDEVHARLARTELLPGEDPALLPEPERTEIGRVLVARVPAEARS
ncbi:hypothetical protein [Geodermatophilus sp. CPCC 205761]|uniref:hypothetical protein n=1 Tax=Geodermatophilus sp. CPCC 205761 TaxID=2936597 RepID=UPI003EEEFA9E